MVIGLVLRAGVVYAVIVATKNYGVWDSPDVAQEVYADAAEQIEPYADKARRQLKICPPRPPPQGEWTFFGIHYYNQLVKSFFDVLSVVPAGMALLLEKMPGYVTSMVESIRKFIKELSSPSKKKEITISKGQLDETPLVRPPGLVPPHCKDKKCKKKPLIPPEGKPGCRDRDIYEPRMPKKSPCECTKCKERPRESWPDRACTRDRDPKEKRCACGEPVQRSELIKSCKQCRKKPEPKDVSN